MSGTSEYINPPTEWELSDKVSEDLWYRIDEEEDNLSECCGAEILDEIWLCSDCKEHC